MPLITMSKQSLTGRHPCAELCRGERIEYGNAYMVSLARTKANKSGKGGSESCLFVIVLRSKP